MAKDLTDLLNQKTPPELVGIKNGPISPGSALYTALGSSEYWYQKYCDLEKQINKKGKKDNFFRNLIFIWLVSWGAFSSYQAIQFRHKAESLQDQIQNLQSQHPK